RPRAGSWSAPARSEALRHRPIQTAFMRGDRRDAVALDEDESHVVVYLVRVVDQTTEQTIQALFEASPAQRGGTVLEPEEVPLAVASLHQSVGGEEHAGARGQVSRHRVRLRLQSQ